MAAKAKRAISLEPFGIADWFFATAFVFNALSSIGELECLGSLDFIGFDQSLVGRILLAWTAA
ncbi:MULTISPECIES: hypothetical protein [Flagellimonas]|uniref:Uncharacterized protein n=1 Tax=Flagellimonas iocasae TaxID=2055905 RepID=A0ABW4XUD1_9FLAO|nr:MULTISPECIES: hypothetical protein [Allomuricauda]